jgi:hypothetical protein
MAAFVSGDVAVGGVREYVEIRDAVGAPSQFVHVTDDGTDSGAQTYITGVTFRTATGELFTTSTPDLLADNCPHAVDNFSNDSGLLVAVVVSSGVLEFRKYDYDGNVLDTWTPEVEAGWGKQKVSISLVCGGAEVYYTMSLKSVLRYSLATSTQLAPYDTLPADSPYIYGAVRVLPGSTGDDRDIIAPMTAAGQGPQRAIAIASRTTFWNTIDNPDDGIYRIEQRLLLDRSVSIAGIETDAEPGGDNDVNLSLAVYFNPCAVRRIFGFVTGLNV